MQLLGSKGSRHIPWVNFWSIPCTVLAAMPFGIARLYATVDIQLQGA